MSRRLSAKEKARRKLDRVRRHFFQKVHKTDSCWLWTGRVTRNGYGQLRAFDRRRWSAHHLSWFLHYGEIPRGQWVLHRCDNRICVRPAHLFLGDHAANMADMVRKNRQASGERCHRKLTAENVAEIRNALKHAVSQGALARQYRVSKSAIHAIKKGRNWRHLPGNPQ